MLQTTIYSTQALSVRLFLHCHYTGGVYTSDVIATDQDGFYNMITYSIDDDYDGVFIMDNITGELIRTTNTRIPAPGTVSNSLLYIELCTYS